MYQILTTLLQPLVILLFILGVGVVSLWRPTAAWRWQRGVLAAGFVGLWLLFLPALSYFALGSLEWRFPPQSGRPAAAEAIVVLGGHIESPTAACPRAVLGWDSYTRCLQAIDLYRDGRECPVFVTGGKVDPEKPGPTIAEAMAVFLVSQGVAVEQVVIEPRATSTYENARETCKLLEARRIRRVVLVTDASHLWRAALCFRKQGYEVIASGCNYATYDFDWSVGALLPSLGAAANFHRVVHEWLGTIYYRLRGWA